MKKITLAFLTIAMMFAGTEVFAQGKYGADSAECIKYLSYYKEYYKQKAFDEATPNWRKAYELCPATASQNLLIEGATIVKRLIQKNAKDAEYKGALVDTLMSLYKTRAEVYPKYAVTALNNMGTDMNNYIKDDPERLYNGYEEIIEANGGDTKPAILLFDLQNAIQLYQDGKIDAEKVINSYQRNNEIIEKAAPANDNEAAQLANVKSDMGSLFAASKVASCETLIELYTPRLEADPENLQLATSIVKTLSMTDDCSNNDLFLKGVTVMNNQNPSAASAYYLYRLHSSRDEVDMAIKYMKEAIASDESDAAQDVEYTYELAAFCYKNGQTANAYELASSISSDATWGGKALFLMGTIWGNTRCGGDEIARRSSYWVACDYMTKAKAADATLTDEANRYIGQYSAYFPKTEDAFMYDITNGQSYTVSCGGMRAVTTVRTVK